MATENTQSSTKHRRWSLSPSHIQTGLIILSWSALILTISFDWLSGPMALSILCAGLMLVSLGAQIWVQRSRQRNLSPLAEWLQSLGLSTRLGETELFSRLKQSVMQHDAETTSRLEGVANEVTSLAQDVTNSIALTNQGVSHQKTETEKLKHAMTEMLTAAESVSSNAQDASEAATNAEESARQGQSILHSTTQAINELAQQVEQSSTVIANLARDSDSIGAILDVIKGVAEQTNLLALNAAIEAARAGEQGRGFAVVADEVRTLASRTHQSTSEIEDMIQRLQQAAQSAAQSMAGGQEIANTSVQEVSKAVATLDAITSAVERIKVMNTQIASAAEEQSAVTQDIKNNVETIDDVSELTMETLESLNETGHKLENLGNAISQSAVQV